MHPYSDFDERAANVMRAVFGGEHHWPRVTKHVMPRFWECSHLGELATFDGDKLTRLVIAAHEHCVRASVGPSGPGRVKIMLHNRKGREGPMHERHPTIEMLRKVSRESI